MYVTDISFSVATGSSQAIKKFASAPLTLQYSLYYTVLHKRERKPIS